MNCPKCGSELEEDGDHDNTVVEADSCHHDFKCTNEDCQRTYTIEYRACEITET